MNSKLPDDWQISDKQYHISYEICQCLCNFGIKVDILDTWGAMIYSYFGIAFPLFFIKIENALYTSCQNSKLLFINGLIFDIMNTQNNQSLKFEWKPMLAWIWSVNDQRFSWLRNVFLVFPRLAEFCLATSGKLYKRCWSENV